LRRRKQSILIDDKANQLITFLINFWPGQSRSAAPAA